MYESKKLEVSSFSSELDRTDSFIQGIEDNYDINSSIKDSPTSKKKTKALLRHEIATITVLSNIGNAKLAGLTDDLNMTKAQYQWSLSIFYFSYVLFDLPSNIIMRLWRPSTWLGTLVFSWGVIATAMAASTNFAGLAICRLLLGAFEAGFFPGVIYFMSLWYTRQEYGRRVGLFFSSSSMAGIIGGFVAYGISQISYDKLKTWQLLFIIEGIPTVLLAIAAMWYLPNSPETARFLDLEEKEFAIKRLEQDVGSCNNHSWSWVQVISVFKDWKTYFYMMIYITGTISLHGVTLFLPSIVSDMGTWSTAESQLLTVPPYTLAFVLTLATAWSSDYFMQRGYHMITINLFGILGFSMLLFLPTSNIAGKYIGACIVTGSVYSNSAIKVAWFNNNYGGLTRRSVASGAIVGFGVIGGAIGGQIYCDPPYYVIGNTVAVSCIILQTVLVITLRCLLSYENKRRSMLTDDQKELEIEKYGGPDLVGDRHYSFRYIL